MVTNRVVITTGDLDGIGLEVAVKALTAIGPQKNTQFILFRSPSTKGSRIQRLGPIFKRKSVTSFDSAITEEFSSETLLEVVSSEDPAVWVERAGRACLVGLCDALVTGPMSKRIHRESGHSIGHTEILQSLSKAPSIYMGFKGSKFAVVLASGHLSLMNSIKQSSQKTLTEAILKAFDLRALLEPHRRHRPVAVLGLNPHAGERGLLGRDEIHWISPTIQKLRKKKFDVVGPLVPDAAFTPDNLTRFSVFVCQYHDQGLIPFKLAHGFNEGVHISLGLPFIRTSVDHGTAKELFNRDAADPGSMIDAIQCALGLLKIRRS